ncbi:MAG: ABC transporter substrate-binding protein [Bacteroidota bacterium]
MRSFQFFKTLSLGLSILLIISSCSSSESPSNNTASATDGKIVQYLSAEPKSLNPFTRKDANAKFVINHLHAPLIDLDYFNYELVPILAKELGTVEKQDDGTVLISMEIRPEAQWDNKEPITGKDVAFSLKAMNVPQVDNKQLRPYFDKIINVVVDENNPKAFTLVFSEPYFIMQDALTDLAIIPAYVYDADGILENYTVAQLTAGGDALDDDAKLIQFAEEFNAPKFDREVIIGAGAYRFDSWPTSERITIVKKEDWWGASLKGVNHWFDNRAEKIVYEIINDPTTAIVALKGGKIDAMYRMTPKTFVEDFMDDLETQEKFYAETPTQFLYSYIGLNMKLEKLTDVNTRKGLRSTMDSEAFGSTVFYGLAEPVNSFIHPSKKEFINPEVPFPAQDLEKAMEYFTAAGWTDSNSDGILDKEIDGEVVNLSLECLYQSSAKTTEAGVLMFQEFAKKIGVIIEPRGLEFSVMLERLKAHDFEIYFGIWGSSPLESDPKQIWHTDSYNGGSNYVGFGNERSDELLEQLRTELDRDERAKIYYEVQQIIHDECPYIFMNATKNRVAISKKFSNVQSTGVNPGFFVAGLQSVDVVAN